MLCFEMPRYRKAPQPYSLNLTHNRAPSLIYIVKSLDRHIVPTIPHLEKAEFPRSRTVTLEKKCTHAIIYQSVLRSVAASNNLSVPVPGQAVR